MVEANCNIIPGFPGTKLLLKFTVAVYTNLRGEKMSFYGDLSKYYKYIFPATEPQLTFFKTLYRENGVKKVLDVACGTGEYTREFAAWGIESYGIDIQREMIQLAQERARKEGLPAFFNTADMLKLPFGNEEFHGTICIGNSLVHLLKEEEILQALQEMRRVTVGDGLIIIQIVNYDKVFQENICQLPLITVKAVGMQLVIRNLALCFHFVKNQSPLQQSRIFLQSLL